MDLVQELTDRLVVAVEEQDVLFSLFWMNESKKSGLLEQVISNKHSTKRRTALESIVSTSFSQLRKVLLQILLLQGADTRLSAAIDLAVAHKNREAAEILRGWRNVDREELKIPLRLLSLPLAEAGDVIDQTLPSPPNAAHLTGYNPLPEIAPAPEAAQSRGATPPVVESVDIPAPTPPRSRDPSPRRSDRQPSFSRRSPVASVEPSIPRPRSPSISSISKPAPTSVERSRRASRDRDRERSRRRDSFDDNDDRPRSKSSRPPASPRFRPPPRMPLDSTNLVRVNVARFPVGWNGVDLEAMFSDIGVPSRTILCHSTYWPTYAFLDVDRDDANRCIRLLEGTLQGDARIRCNFAGRQGGGGGGPQNHSFRDSTTTSSSSVSVNVSSSSRPQIPTRPPSSPSSSSRTGSLYPPRSHSSRFSPPLTSTNTINTSRNGNHASGGGGGRDSSSSRSNARNVMILNLPYHETDEARIVVNKLRYFDLIRLSERDQAVAWFPETTRGDHLIKLWDDYVVDGKRLRVVYARDGLEADEAIEDYFKNSATEPPSDSIRKGGGGESSRSTRRTEESRSSRSSRSETGRSRRRSRSRSIGSEDEGGFDDDRSYRSRKSGGGGGASSSKRSKTGTTTTSTTSRGRHRSRSVDSNTSYGPSPPPPSKSTTDGATRNSTSRAGSRSSSSKYKSPSSSSRRHHRERSSRSSRD